MEFVELKSNHNGIKLIGVFLVNLQWTHHKTNTLSNGQISSYWSVIDSIKIMFTQNKNIYYLIKDRLVIRMHNHCDDKVFVKKKQ